MAIEDPTLYSDGQLEAGKIANLEDYRVNTLTAGADIKFGQAVAVQNGVAVPATKAPIYGVCLTRGYTDSINFDPTEMANDHYSAGDAIDALRDGSVSVPVSEDVNAQDNATVDANGQFKTAGASDAIVGVFLSSGNKGGTAVLQTRVQFGTTASSNSTGAQPATTQNTQSATGSVSSQGKTN